MCNDCIKCYFVEGKYYSIAGSRFEIHNSGYNLSDKVSLPQAELDALRPSLIELNQLLCIEAMARVTAETPEISYSFADKVVGGKVVGVNIMEIVNGTSTEVFSYTFPKLNITSITGGFNLSTDNGVQSNDITFSKTVAQNGTPYLNVLLDGVVVTTISLPNADITVEGASFDPNLEKILLPLKDLQGNVVRTEELDLSKFLSAGDITSTDNTIGISVSTNGKELDLSSKLETVRKLICYEDGGNFYAACYSYVRNLLLPHPDSLKPITGTERWTIVEEDGVVPTNFIEETVNPVANLVPCNTCCPVDCGQFVPQYHDTDLQLEMYTTQPNGGAVDPDNSNDTRTIIMTITNVGHTDIVNTAVDLIFPEIIVGAASNSVAFTFIQTQIGVVNSGTTITYVPQGTEFPVVGTIIENGKTREIRRKVISLAVGNSLTFGFELGFTYGIVEINPFDVELKLSADTNPDNNRASLIFFGYTT